MDLGSHLNLRRGLCSKNCLRREFAKTFEEPDRKVKAAPIDATFTLCTVSAPWHLSPLDENVPIFSVHLMLRQELQGKIQGSVEDRHPTEAIPTLEW